MPGWQDFTSFSQQFLSADLLTSDLTGILNPSLTYLPVIEHGIAALSISLTAQVAGEITVKVTDASGIVPAWSQRQAATGFGDVLQFMVPYSFTTISALNIQITSSVNQVHNCPTFIIGYGAPPNGSQGNQLVRPDGRDYPSNSQFASNQVTNGSVVHIAAPGAGLHILLGSVNLLVSAGLEVYSVTIGGLTQNLFIAEFAAQYSPRVPESGLLLDANTAATLTASGAGSTIVAASTYDIVT